MTRALLLGLILLAASLQGNLILRHESPSLMAVALPVEVRLGPLAPGSTAGANGTNGTATLAGALLSTTTSLYYLNNTNATGASFATLSLNASAGLESVSLLEIGIDNGTRVAQITASALGISLAEGTPVRLAPGSVNRIYVTQAVTSLDLLATIRFDILVADDTAGSAVVTTRAALTLD